MRKTTLLFIALFTTAYLIAQDFSIESYDVQIQVHKNATFDVVETIVVDFKKERRGIFRDIPLNYELESASRNIEVRDINVDNYKYKTSQKNGILTIRIGDKDIYLTGKHRYVIRYQVKGAFNWLDNHTEFYWDIIGDRWKVIIPEVAFAVDFPEDLSLRENDYRIFVPGKEGRTTTRHSEHTIYGQTTNALSPGEALTMAVKLPVDLIAEPVPPAPVPFRKDLLAIPAMLLAFLSGLWYRIGRRKKVMPAEIEQLYPPDGYNPAFLGMLHDHKVQNRDIIALLPWWAASGYIKMANVSKTESEGLNLRLEKVEELPEGAAEYQHYFYNSIFKEGDLVFLNDFNNVFYTYLDKTKQLLRSEFKERGLYDQQARSVFKSGWMILFAIVCVGIGLSFFVLFQQVISGVFVLLVALAAFSLHFLRPKLSETGRYLKSQLLRFHRFLKDPDMDKIDALAKEDPLYFEKMFPYAVAFGFDQQWVSQFNNIFTKAPTWYAYEDGLYYDDHHSGYRTPSFKQFSESFQTEKIAQVFDSRPAPTSTGGGSSSGGGFSGGSSGGGFGGGGGGSW